MLSLSTRFGGCHLESHSCREVRAFCGDRSRNRDGRVGAGLEAAPKSQRDADRARAVIAQSRVALH